MRSDEIISQSQLANEFNLSPARISQLVQKGLPVRRDGRFNRAVAAEWLEANRSFSFRGGWGRGLREIERRREAAESDVTYEVNLTGMGLANLPEAAGDYARLSDYQRGLCDFVNAIRRPIAREAMARCCVLRGVPIAYAFHAAEVWDYLCTTWMHDFIAHCLGKRKADVIYRFEAEPDWEALAHFAGESCDVEKWKADARLAQQRGAKRLKKITQETKREK